MQECDNGCCGFEVSRDDLGAEDIWLEDQAHKLAQAIPDNLFMEIREIFKEARESSPLSPYLTERALMDRLGDVFEDLLFSVAEDLDKE